MILTPKNWKSFQHYKERTPSWIKLHKGLLTDFTFNRLPLASRALAPMLWLLASEYEDGAITASQEEIAFRLHVTDKDLTEALKPLIDSGFFIASEPLSECTQEAIPEKRDIEQNIDKRERKETREVALSFDPVEFHVFWEDWPNKVGKPAAVKALAAARKRGALFGEIMDGVRSYIRDKPPDRPWLNPATFLNQNRWEDQPATVVHNGRIQETENLSAVARRHAATGITFGERPTTPSLCVIPSGPDVRLLPQGGGERSGDLRGGDGGGSERIPAGGD